jgi:hypothetical protein
MYETEKLRAALPFVKRIEFDTASRADAHRVVLAIWYKAGPIARIELPDMPASSETLCHHANAAARQLLHPDAFSLQLEASEMPGVSNVVIKRQQIGDQTVIPAPKPSRALAGIRGLMPVEKLAAEVRKATGQELTGWDHELATLPTPKPEQAVKIDSGKLERGAAAFRAALKALE